MWHVNAIKIASFQTPHISESFLQEVYQVFPVNLKPVSSYFQQEEGYEALWNKQER